GLGYRRQPRLAPLDPALPLRHEGARRRIERADRDLGGLVVEVEEPRPAIWAEAAPGIGRVLPLVVERGSWPVRVVEKGAAGLLAAVGAVAEADHLRLAGDPVAHRAARASALVDPFHHALPQYRSRMAFICAISSRCDSMIRSQSETISGSVSCASRHI